MSIFSGVNNPGLGFTQFTTAENAFLVAFADHAWTNGQLAIGNTATGGVSFATLTQGSGVTITNGNGTITIAASGGSGLTVGTTTITSGTSGRLLYDNSAVLGEALLSYSAATLQLGDADAAAPAAQTVKVQNVVTGTSNTAGANLTIKGSQSTGNAAGGSIIFQTSPLGGSGTSVNALATAMTITGSGLITIPGALTVTGNVVGNNVTVSGRYLFASSSQMFATSDGIIKFTDSTAATFTAIHLGGDTASFPAIKRNTTAINFRLADDTADTGITAASGVFSTTLSVTGHTTFEGVTSTGATGTGKLVYDGTPTLVTPVLGTPTSGTLTNCTGYTVANISGLGTGVATALAVNIGSAGAFITFNGALGTPSSGTLTNATGLPIAGLTASTSTAIGVGSVELGNATDTTIARVSGGVVSIEGVNIMTVGAAQTATGQNKFNNIIDVNNAIAASSNAATVPVTFRLNTVTNSSAATLTITMTTTSAVDGQMTIVRILDFSAVAQTVTWVNTENSTVTAPTTSNGSTTLPLTVGFMYNTATSKWRCIASA